MSKQIDGYQDVLDFACQMRVNGTPELAGTFPTLVPSRPRAGRRLQDRRARRLGDQCRARDAALPGDRRAGDESRRGLLEDDRSEPAADSKLTRHAATSVLNNLYSNNVVFPKYGITFTDGRSLPHRQPVHDLRDPDRSDRRQGRSRSNWHTEAWNARPASCNTGSRTRSR